MVKCALVSFTQTYYIGVLLYLPIGMIDFAIYIFVSQKFYALLKGMRNAASLHSTEYEYFQKKGIVKRFFYARLLTISMMSLLLIIALICFIQISFQVVTGCFLSYITLDYIPSITVSEKFIEQMVHYCLLTKIVFLFIVELVFTVLYLALSVEIIVKLIWKRRRYNSCNSLITRPLMENYRNSLI